MNIKARLFRLLVVTGMSLWVAGCGKSNDSQDTPPPPPPPPSYPSTPVITEPQKGETSTVSTVKVAWQASGVTGSSWYVLDSYNNGVSKNSSTSIQTSNENQTGSITLTSLGDGSHTFTVNLCNDAGCSASVPVTITVSTAPPPPSAPTAPGITNIKNGDATTNPNVTLNWQQISSGVPGTSWKVLDNGVTILPETILQNMNTPQSGTASLSFTTGGSHPLVVQLCNTAGCTDSAAVTLTVNPPPQPNQPQVTSPSSLSGPYPQNTPLPVTWSWSAAAGVQGTEWTVFVDGKQVGPTYTAFNPNSPTGQAGQTSVNLSQYATDTNHTLMIKLCNTNVIGSTCNSSSDVSFTITPPPSDAPTTPDMSQPTDQAALTVKTVTVSWETRPPSGQTTVVTGDTWRVLNGGTPIPSSSGTPKGDDKGQKGSIDLTLDDGLYALAVQLCNKEVCSTSNQANITVNTQASPATATIKSPIPNQVVGNSVKVTWQTASGSVAATSWQVWDSAAPNNPIYQSTSIDTAGDGSQSSSADVTLPVSSGSNPWHNLTVKLYNGSLQPSSSESVSVYYPTGAPATPVIIQQSGTLQGNTMALSWKWDNSNGDSPGTTWQVKNNDQIIYTSDTVQTTTVNGQLITGQSDQTGASSPLVLTQGNNVLTVELCNVNGVNAARSCTASNSIKIEQYPPKPIVSSPTVGQPPYNIVSTNVPPPDNMYIQYQWSWTVPAGQIGIPANQWKVNVSKPGDPSFGNPQTYYSTVFNNVFNNNLLQGQSGDSGTMLVGNNPYPGEASLQSPGQYQVVVQLCNYNTFVNDQGQTQNLYACTYSDPVTIVVGSPVPTTPVISTPNPNPPPDAPNIYAPDGQMQIEWSWEAQAGQTGIEGTHWKVYADRGDSNEKQLYYGGYIDNSNVPQSQGASTTVTLGSISNTTLSPGPHSITIGLCNYDGSNYGCSYSKAVSITISGTPTPPSGKFITMGYYPNWITYDWKIRHGGTNPDSNQKASGAPYGLSGTYWQVPKEGDEESSDKNFYSMGTNADANAQMPNLDVIAYAFVEVYPEGSVTPTGSGQWAANTGVTLNSADKGKLFLFDPWSDLFRTDANNDINPNHNAICDASKVVSTAATNYPYNHKLCVGRFEESGTLSDNDIWDWENYKWKFYLGNFSKFATLNQDVPNSSKIKRVISIGGWGHEASFEAGAFENPDNFVGSVVFVMQQFNLDGVDLDYEPGANTPSTTGYANNAVNLVNLATKLRAAFDDPANFGDAGKNKLITAAVFANPDEMAAFNGSGGKNGNWSKLAAQLDYIGIMGYDYHGNWEAQNGPAPTNFHSNLRVTKDPDDFSTEKAVQALLSYGVPAGKIVVGVPSYARVESGVLLAAGNDPSQPGLFQLFTQNNFIGDMDLVTQEQIDKGAPPAQGQQSYYSIVHATNSIDLYGKVTTNPSWLSSNYTSYLYEDNVSYGASWIFNPNTMIFASYDTTAVVQVKANYVVSNSLGGMMMWDLSSDTPPGDNTSLLCTMADVLHQQDGGCIKP